MMEINVDVDTKELARSVAANRDGKEVMNFLVRVDEEMVDYQFSQELIIRLAGVLASEVEVKSWDLLTVPGIQDTRKVSFSQLCGGLSYLDEDKLIALLANAVHVKRKREDKPLPLATMCVCDHNLNWHKESHGPDKGCMVESETGYPACDCTTYRAKSEEKA